MIPAPMRTTSVFGTSDLIISGIGGLNQPPIYEKYVDGGNIETSFHLTINRSFLV
jgi:hypothetical protein